MWTRPLGLSDEMCERAEWYIVNVWLSGCGNLETAGQSCACSNTRCPVKTYMTVPCETLLDKVLHHGSRCPGCVDTSIWAFGGTSCWRPPVGDVGSGCACYDCRCLVTGIAEAAFAGEAAESTVGAAAELWRNENHNDWRFDYIPGPRTRMDNSSD